MEQQSYALGKNKSINKNSNLFIFFLFRASFHNN